ncbi:uncharacterized protein [Apostichopus japonicus]|uniref:uncharacterized protein isoform X2 n=1 Tax=Stichopus japonicus TaxID=307972 RepID=UPI003AB79BB4
MKITTKLLSSEAEKQGIPISEVKYLDLSSHGIANIEHLERCCSIQTLLLRGNNVSIIENLALCHQLWHVDISCNDVSNLYTLSRFIALGYLNLSYNNISWNELMKIRHMHILELCLHGNHNLEKDPNYRIHIIDSIPCVWMLDGRQVTAAERVQVQDFFQQSALTNHPVRKKLTREQFIPSSLKKLQVEGSYGLRTVHLMMRFPKAGALNVSTDRRRLQYLAYNLQEDLKIEYNCRQSKFSPLPIPDFESLLEARVENSDQCNVLLLLLVTFLDFRLPFDLLQETITCAKLDQLCETDVRLIFALPKNYICRFVTILLSSVKIDRDDRKETGLYEKLYLSLHFTVDELIRANKNTKKRIIHKPNHRYRDLRALLGCEAIQLFCIVPEFFNILTTHESVSELVVFSSGDGAAVEKVKDLMQRVYSQGGSDLRMVEEVADFLVNMVQKRAKKLLGKQMVPNITSNHSFVMKKSTPRRPQSSPMHSSSYLSIGLPSPRHNISVTRPGSAAPKVSPIKPPWRPERQPKLGDKVLLGRQNVSFILALPEHDVALIQMESIPDLSDKWKAPSSSVFSFTKNTQEHYSYLDLSQFLWDWRYSYWKPLGTTGDRITLHNNDDGLNELAAVGSNPPAIDEESPRDADDNEDDTTTIHPSPRDSVENLPLPMSALVREKLKLTSPSSHRSSPENEDLRLKLQNDIGDDGVDEADGNLVNETEGHEMTHSTGSETEKGLLYDCIKCAMDSVRENNQNVSRDTNPSENALRDETRETSLDLPQSPDKSPDLIAETSTMPPDKTLSPKHQINLDLSPKGLSQIDREKAKQPTRQRPKSSYHYRSKSSRSSGASNRPSTASSLSRREPSGNPVMIQMGNFWLAGGRDVNFQARLENFQKTQHTPGWMDGSSKRPKSVGPRQKSLLLQRRAKSAGTQREPDLWVGVSSSSSNQPPPSPASSDISSSIGRTSPEPDYLLQSRQQNYPNYPASLGSDRPNTPPYGAPKRPSSPLEMTVK